MGRGEKEIKARVRALAAALALVLVALPLSARADCLDEAADYWGVPRMLARAVAMHESGMRANAVNRNKDGSLDFGLMQINSLWLPTLGKLHIPKSDLFDACKNAYIGNWILAQKIAQYGPTWNAIGAYNAGSPEKREAYVKKIYDQMMSFTAGEPLPATGPMPNK